MMTWRPVGSTWTLCNVLVIIPSRFNIGGGIAKSIISTSVGLLKSILTNWGDCPPLSELLGLGWPWTANNNTFELQESECNRDGSENWTNPNEKILESVSV